MQKGVNFCDWDEISPDELNYLNMLKSSDVKESIADVKNTIHCKYDSAFHPHTKITLKDGKKIYASQVKLGDKLKTGETITSIISVDLTDMDMYRHTIYGKTIYGTNNIVFINEDEERCSTLYQHDREFKEKYEPCRKIKKGFHFNTDKKYITIHHIRFAQYNQALETLLPSH